MTEEERLEFVTDTAKVPGNSWELWGIPGIWDLGGMGMGREKGEGKVGGVGNGERETGRGKCLEKQQE